ncbi:TPA: hypothetical protein ACH3X1_013638 [Trebouxia sp. C0004]
MDRVQDTQQRCLVAVIACGILREACSIWFSLRPQTCFKTVCPQPLAKHKPHEQAGESGDASPIWPGFVLGPRCLTTTKHRPAVLRYLFFCKDHANENRPNTSPASTSSDSQLPPPLNTEAEWYKDDKYRVGLTGTDPFGCEDYRKILYATFPLSRTDLARLSNPAQRFFPHNSIRHMTPHMIAFADAKIRSMLKGEASRPKQASDEEITTMGEMVQGLQDGTLDSQYVVPRMSLEPFTPTGQML